MPSEHAEYGFSNVQNFDLDLHRFKQTQQTQVKRVVNAYLNWLGICVVGGSMKSNMLHANLTFEVPERSGLNERPVASHWGTRKELG